MPKTPTQQISIIRRIRILEKRLLLQLSCLLIDTNSKIAYRRGIDNNNLVIVILYIRIFF